MDVSGGGSANPNDRPNEHTTISNNDNPHNYPEIIHGEIIIGSEYTRVQEIMRRWYFTSFCVGTMLFAMIYFSVYHVLQKSFQTYYKTCIPQPTDHYPFDNKNNSTTGSFLFDLDDPSCNLNLDENDLDFEDFEFDDSYNANSSNNIHSDGHDDDWDSDYFSTAHSEQESPEEYNNSDINVIGETELFPSLDLASRGEILLGNTNESVVCNNTWEEATTQISMGQQTAIRNDHNYDGCCSDWEDIIVTSSSLQQENGVVENIATTTNNNQSHSEQSDEQLKQYSQDLLSMPFVDILTGGFPHR